MRLRRTATELYSLSLRRCLTESSYEADRWGCCFAVCCWCTMVAGRMAEYSMVRPINICINGQACHSDMFHSPRHLTFPHREPNKVVIYSRFFFLIPFLCASGYRTPRSTSRYSKVQVWGGRALFSSFQTLTTFQTQQTQGFPPVEAWHHGALRRLYRLTLLSLPSQGPTNLLTPSTKQLLTYRTSKVCYCRLKESSYTAIFCIQSTTLLAHHAVVSLSCHLQYRGPFTP